MRVTKLEYVTKTKCKVYLEEQFAFVLYKGELSRYGIKEEAEISEEIKQQVLEEVIAKRAKMRAMYLLKDMDRTEEQLRTKLRQNLYPEEIVEKAIAYVKSFGYIADDSYAERFVMGRQATKSRREIYMALCQKGIEKELIENTLERCYEFYDEKDTIRNLMRKKRFSPGTCTDAEKKKIYEYLMRKGFRGEDVRQVIQVSSWNA